jgi:hypothetical protein
LRAFDFILLQYINFVFFLSFAGYYQPAGPLISSHLLQQQQQPQQLSTKTVPTPLDSDSHPLLQQPPQSTSTADSTDSDVLITGILTILT